MKKYIFIITTIFAFMLFASCSSGSSGKYDSDCFKVQITQHVGNTRCRIVTYYDSEKMKRYTFFVCSTNAGCGCTLIDTEDIK